ncbi:histone acetyltransferase type B catalytic subunit [Condylostylus longicornis]|uniref:histone acetyltransferase type B catalytic subunit n=1 Tax=Condylostylus longicornis TaxID=2530218 RepID=UPI00244D9D9D|nr:histone acetyltransferase type B catalytic subunit [Condylostylus longicornis]
MTDINIEELRDLVSDAVKVVEFKLVRTRDDVNDPTLNFHPEMAHQIFGENENIFGYKDLKITIMYTAGSMQIYIGMVYISRVEDQVGSKGLKSDDVMNILASKLPDGCYYINLEEFLKAADSENFRPFGEKLDELTYEDEETGQKRHFEIYHCDNTASKFVSYFNRFQTFILWFVDAAQYIDVDDPQWTFFICYEKYKSSDGDVKYASVGYTTVYQYYAYPEHIRPRISQMLILPPFQKKGLGTKMFNTIYKFYEGEKNVIDITVEDPSEDFTRIRNYIDSKLCKDLNSFSKEEIKKGFSKEMIKEAREKHKINPRQCRKIYEILRYYHTNIYDPKDLRSFRLEVKRRLNIIHHKQLRDIKRMEKAGLDTQWITASMPTREERLSQLEKEYEDVETEYKKIVEKLKN